MKHYVYIYLNPLKAGAFRYGKFEFTCEPFYVGIGCGNRINRHIVLAKTHKQKTFKDNVILKITAQGQQPIRYKLYEQISIESAKRLERYLIKLIGRRDLETGTLVNLTDGGDGTNGYRMSKDRKLKQQKLMTNRWKIGEFSNRDYTGEKNPFHHKQHTEETKDKIRRTIGNSRKGEQNANYGNPWTDEMKQTQSIKRTGKCVGDANSSKRPDVRKKISLSKMGEGNPNALRWVLISPEGSTYVIEGGIKRTLKQYGLDYQQFPRIGVTRKNKSGWELRIVS